MHCPKWTSTLLPLEFSRKNKTIIADVLISSRPSVSRVPSSFILPQLCAHGAFKSHQTTLLPVCSFTHSASDHPCTPPPVVRFRPFPGPLASFVRSIHGDARGEELLHHGGVAVVSRPLQRCPTSGAEGLGDVNGWLHPVALQWEKLQSVE